MVNKLIPLEKYQQRFHYIEIDKAKFSKIKGTIIGKDFMEGIDYDLLIQNEIKHLFINRPTFEKYTKVDESYKKY